MTLFNLLGNPLAILGIIALIASFFTLLLIRWVLNLRIVVPTSQVHVVQKAGETLLYGKAAQSEQNKVGNAYYNFPSWIPVLGVNVTILDTGIFDRDLKDYEAYDKDRLPFMVDVKTFFRIKDFGVASVRVVDMKELKEQLDGIVQGAVRSLLAKEDLESIMSERNKYGKQFTEEVAPQLAQWGVETVKNIELMDIRDSRDSKVIQNIMAKKKSQIEMESRTTVAENSKKASQAEIEANKEVALKQQDAEREVGLRTAEVNQEVGIANEKQKQQVQEQAKVTAEKEMEVKRVQEVKAAEIEKQAAEIDANKNKEVITINAQANVARTEADKKVAILNAEANKEQTLLDAEAQKQKITLKAEADLVTATNEAKGIEAKGKATAQASELAKKASVQDQVTLAEKVGENKPYQDFLIQQKQIEVQGEVMKAVGVAQAQNLSGADIKMFVSSGSVPEGVSKAAGIFNPDNALNIASMLEAFKSTPMGAEIVDKLLGTGNAVKTIETIKGVSEEVNKKRPSKKIVEIDNDK